MPLYHVTHRRNIASIRRVGVDPAFSRGRMRCVYVVRGDRIGWAVAHCIARHDWTPKSLVVLEVVTSGLDAQRTHVAGVFRYFVPLKLRRVL